MNNREAINKINKKIHNEIDNKIPKENFSPNNNPLLREFFKTEPTTKSNFDKACAERKFTEEDIEANLEAMTNAYAREKRQELLKQHHPVYKQLHASLKKLGLEKYVPTDARAFEGNLHEDSKEKILANLQKKFASPTYKPAQSSGAYGAGDYTPGIISKTTEYMKKMEAGACAQFAMLAISHLTEEMNKRNIPTTSLKMVSSRNHTFVLLGHEGNDLEDLSGCTIIDLWMDRMGHTGTNGIYLQSTYPDQDMLRGLEDMRVPNMLISPEVAKPKANGSTATIQQQLGSHTNTSAATNTPAPTRPQLAAHPQQTNTTQASDLGFYGNNNKKNRSPQQIAVAETMIPKETAIEFITQCYKGLTDTSRDGAKGALIRNIITTINNPNTTSDEVEKYTIQAIDVFFTNRKGVVENSWRDDAKGLTKSGKKVLELLMSEDKTFDCIKKKLNLSPANQDTEKSFLDKIWTAVGLFLRNHSLDRIFQPTEKSAPTLMNRPTRR